MDSRPEYRVAAAGLDPRDVRLIEIVFKHSQYNRYAFRFEAKPDPLGIDILIVNPLAPEGLRAVARVRSAGRSVPVISAMPRGATSSARHAISIDRLTLQLLPILNRVVELELRRPKEESAAAGASPAARAAGAASAGAASAGAAFADPEGERSTRDFLREAARKSREGDLAREAAARARAGAAGASASAAAAAAAAESPPSAPAAAAPSNLVAFPRSAEPAPPRIRVLVVDDSPTVRQQLSIAFSRMNVLCDTAASAGEALARLSETHYDLVLVDVVMPGVDGYKLTRQIRRRHRGVPVIILTSRSSPFDLARGALAGCNSYLVKPVPLRQLEAAVVKQLRKSLAIDDLGELLRLSPAPQASAAARSAGPGAATPQAAPARTQSGGGGAG
ncbi:MAG: response regulator [Burkholderiaceae bacterium]|nr:response regulator [Burkholderiaceae bacterium]